MKDTWELQNRRAAYRYSSQVTHDVREQKNASQKTLRDYVKRRCRLRCVFSEGRVSI